jgi:hypothetical protein
LVLSLMSSRYVLVPVLTTVAVILSFALTGSL